MITRRTLNVAAHSLTLFSLLGTMAGFFAVGGWATLYALCVLPLAVCSALCVWAAHKERPWMLLFFSALLLIVGLGGGLTGLWDNQWRGNT